MSVITDYATAIRFKSLGIGSDNSRKTLQTLAHITCVGCRRRNTLCDGIVPCKPCISRDMAAICVILSRDAESHEAQDSASEHEIKQAHTNMAAVMESWKQAPSEEARAIAVNQFIEQLVMEATCSRRGKEVLLSFRDEQAKTIMLWIEECINDMDLHLFTPDHADDCYHILRRLLVKISKNAGTLPPSLFLSDVKCRNRDSVAGGGFADIFQANYQGRPVALKRLRVFKTKEEREKSRKAFCAEALVWQQLKHKYILPFLGVDLNTFSPFHCMVSPWMDNGNIIQFINLLLLDENQTHVLVNRWLRQIAEGLDHLHSQKVVHGDLRGANILINDELAVQLCDFGLAVFEDSTTASWGSIVGGAVRWLAPEVLKGSRPTFKSDAYAFGCVCLEVLTRQHPFIEIGSDLQVVARVLQGARPKVPVTLGRLPQGLWTLIEMCWNDDQAKRPDAALLAKTLSSRDDKYPAFDQPRIAPKSNFRIDDNSPRSITSAKSPISIGISQTEPPTKANIMLTADPPKEVNIRPPGISTNGSSNLKFSVLSVEW